MNRLFGLMCAVVLFALAGCPSGQTPDVKALKAFKQHAAAKEWKPIADADFVCGENKGVCVQLHLIKGQACFKEVEAMEARQNTSATPVALNDRLDCAIANLRAGIDMNVPAGVEPDPIPLARESLLGALYDRLHRSSQAAQIQAINTELARRAAAFRSDYAGQPAGYYYGALALRSEANTVGGAAGCVRLRDAERLIKTGRANPGRYASRFNESWAGVTNSLLLRECP